MSADLAAHTLQIIAWRHISLPPLRNGRWRIPKLIDPACGTGTLLVAAVEAITESKLAKTDELLAQGVFGVDLSGKALRGALLSLVSLARSRSAVQSLVEHLKHLDCLKDGPAALQSDCGGSFDIVIGNPPWERLKLSRHEFLTSNGTVRHYGADYEDLDEDHLLDARDILNRYVTSVALNFLHQGRGDRDLYKLFLELAVTLTKPGGYMLFLVPAGLIRSQGSADLRRFLFNRCSELQITLFDNRSKFFEIDTRFKFLALHYRPAKGKRFSPIKLLIPRSQKTGIEISNTVRMGRKSLARLRSDLSVPEVRSAAEWRLFTKMVRKGRALGDPDGPWQPKIVREIDMTLDRASFKRQPDSRLLPVVEGRMIHQFDFTAKRYYSGTGRRAVWLPTPADCKGSILPQFWFPRSELSDPVRERFICDRYGFCDITGQTNERTMLASRILRNTVCGNKVPTITFACKKEWSRPGDCWLAIANSIPFDWLLRRVVTTSVNFFSPARIGSSYG